MKTRKKLSAKLFSGFLAILTIVSTFFTSALPVFASSLNLDEPTEYYYTGVSPNTGYAMTHNIYVLKMDGKKVFCIESGIIANSGEGYIPETYINAKKDKLSKIAYYGYTNTGKSHYDYAVTQVMIWEELGDQYHSSTIPNYQQRKKEILAMVNRHDILPSWNGQEVTIKVGDSVTLTDSNRVLSDMNLESNSTNTNLKQNGNTIVVTPSKDSNNGTITYRKVPKNEVGTSIVYRKPHEQSMVEFHLENAKQASIKINVIKLGNLQVTKIDEDTGQPLANTKLKFEYSGLAKEVVTNSNGLATINNIPEGTKVTITEIQAPNGYVNAGLSQSVIIEPNKTIKVTFNNKEQKGIATLVKTGETPKGIETIESDYGIVHKFIYDYKPIAGVTYRIEATKDIYSNDGTLKVKKGDTVATVTTNEKGEWQSPELYLGDYQAIEASAPDGYVLDTRPLPFSLVYAGQEVKLSTVSLTAKNDFQSLDIQLFKNEEYITDWENNHPIIENIKADGKVFGLYTNEVFSISENTSLPRDSLISYTTVKDGIASFELKLPEGKYYLKELDAGASHVLINKHYEFEFTAENNHTSFPIHIYDEVVVTGMKTLQKIEHAPLLNKLHLNSFSIKKTNEKAYFDKETGVEFIFDGMGTGAIFTLENDGGEILQEITVNDDNLATFTSIPIGTFYLKENATSSKEYLLSDSVVRIESTKDGIIAYDEQENILGQDKYDGNEPSIIFEVKNYLKKGTAKLTKKDVSSGVLLPDTGVRILNDKKEVIAEGRTNDKGVFTFDLLPVGTYYFQEFDAPEGYQLDDTPIPFAIKENDEVMKSEMTNKKIEIPDTPTYSLPKTGDTTNIGLFGLGLVVSLSVIGLLIYRKKKTTTK